MISSLYVISFTKLTYLGIQAAILFGHKHKTQALPINKINFIQKLVIEKLQSLLLTFHNLELVGTPIRCKI